MCVDPRILIFPAESAPTQAQMAQKTRPSGEYTYQARRQPPQLSSQGERAFCTDTSFGPRTERASCDGRTSVMTGEQPSVAESTLPSAQTMKTAVAPGSDSSASKSCRMQAPPTRWRAFPTSHRTFTRWQ